MEIVFTLSAWPLHREENLSLCTNILLSRLIALGRAFRFKILAGKLLDIDVDAIKLCRSMIFSVQGFTEEGTIQVLLEL
jgi:hypothetical protein